MQFIKKIPFLLGWVAFYLSMQLLVWLFGLWVSPSISDLFSQLTPSASFLSLMSLFVMIGFFVFRFSISKVVLPLYSSGKVRAEEGIQLPLASYLWRWLLYLIYSIVYSIPLAIKGWLPTGIEEPFQLVWPILASFLAYRGVVHSWLDDVVLQAQRSTDDRIVTA